MVAGSQRASTVFFSSIFMQHFVNSTFALPIQEEHDPTNLTRTVTPILLQPTLSLSYHTFFIQLATANAQMPPPPRQLLGSCHPVAKIGKPLV